MFSIVSTKKILRSKRRFLKKRVASVVARQIRFGKRVKLQQLGSVPETAEEAVLLKKFLKEIDVARQKNPSSKKLERLKAKVRVLRVSNTLREALGGRQPTIYHILAVTVLQYGLRSAELKQHANSLISIWANERRGVNWSGAPHLLIRAIRMKIPFSVEKLLFDAKNKAVNSRDLAKRLSIDWNPKNQDLINASLQLLEIAGLVKKMPLWIQSNGIALSVWTHARTRNPPITYPNLEIDILSRLQKESLLVSQLQKQYRFPATFYGKPVVVGSKDGVFSAQVYNGVRKLEEAGLIKIEKDKKQRKTGEVKISRARLTSLGKKLLAEHNKSESTPEALRRLLLSEKEK